MVLVNYELGEGEVEYILNDSAPKYIFSSKEFKDLARKASLAVGSIQKHYVFKAAKYEGDFTPSGTLMLDGPADSLRENEDIKEFYLGLSAIGKRKSYREVKHYRRWKRWL